MKYIITLLILVFSIPSLAQPCGTNFSYDNAGNRIKRYQCWGSLNLVQNEGEIVENFLNEQGMLESNSSNDDSEMDFNLRQRNSEFQDISSLVVFPNPTVGQF